MPKKCRPPKGKEEPERNRVLLGQSTQGITDKMTNLLDLKKMQLFSV